MNIPEWCLRINQKLDLIIKGTLIMFNCKNAASAIMIEEILP